MPPAPKSFASVHLRPKRQGTGTAVRLAAGAVLAVTLALPTAAGARDLYKQDAYSNYKPDPKNGEYIAAAGGCAACHASGDDQSLLAGGLKMDTFIGTFFVPNITDSAQGIGGWSNADFLNAVLNGVGQDGRHLYPVMPYTSYAGMKPEDVLDVKAYIASLPKSDNKVEAHRLSFPYNLSATIAFWKRGNFDTPSFQPGETGQLERGRYLVENVGACGECHTPRTMDFGLDKTRPFEGEKGLTGAVAPAITRARMASVSEDAFTQGVLVEGKKLNGSPLSDPVMAHFAQGTAKLSEEDRLAMLAYLKGGQIDKPKIVPVAEACKASSAEATLASAGGGASLAAAADDFVGKYCRNCHGPGESSQGSFPAGDLASIAANAAFVTPGDKSRSLLYTSVASGRMPLGKRPSDSELQSLGSWIDSLNDAPVGASAAKTPPKRQRDVLSWRDFAQAAVTDINDLTANDRPFIRYFSYRHEFNGKLPCETEKAFEKRMALYVAGFNKLLNSVSLGSSLVVPEEIPGTKDLLVRVDLRDLEWTADKWDKLIARYPYGYDPAGDSLLKTLSTDTDTDLPIMRIDWFMSNAGAPELYYDLLDLPKNITEFEKNTLGVDADDNIKRRRVIRAAFDEGTSGVSDHNRMIERHSTRQGGYYWKSYDFAGSRDLQSLKRHPHGPPEIEPLDEGLTSFHHDGGEMIFSLPNGMQGYYLSTAKGDRLDRGPASIVSFRNRPIGKGVEIVNARSCFDCHADGTIAKRDTMREFIESSPTFSLSQRDLLLEMYVEQDELDKNFAADRERFIGALEKINATEKAPDGTLKSMGGPAKEEIITWFADLYEDDLDADALAAEFDMKPEEFEQAIQRVGDSTALKLGLDWITQLKGGSKVPRFEVEQQFAKLVKPLMNLDPLEKKTDEAATTNESKSDAKKDKDADKTAAVDTPDYKDPDYRDDAFKGDEAKEGKLTLALKVKNTDVFIDEQLTFEVTANKKCELQIFYIEADGNVEVVPQEMIGDAFLEPGKARTIPDPATGALVFDTEGADETLLLFCREGGLGDQRLSADAAKDLVKKSNQPASRGLAIKLFEKAKAEEAKADAKNADTGGKGTSAIHMVTFNVKART